MNILFIHETDWIDKVVFEMHNLAEELSMKGHNVYAIDYPHKWNNRTKCGEYKCVRRASKNGYVTLIRPAFIKVPILSRISAFITHFFAIRSVIKENKIDVIMLYSVATNGLQTVFWAKYYNIPIVFRSLDILHQLVPKILRVPTKILERIVYRNVNIIMPITYKLSDYLSRLGASMEKIYLLPLLVDTDKFHPVEIEDKQIVLFVGSLHEFSGVQDIIIDFRQISNECRDAKLFIVGDGEYRAKLQALIDELDLNDKIIITGYKQYEDIPDYINAASVCICPFHINSITKDIFPSKIIQYMACAKPVVSTILDGITDFMPDNNGCIIYSTVSMAPMIIELLKDNEKRKIMGMCGYEYVQSEHSHKVITNMLEWKLEELINDKRC